MIDIKGSASADSDLCASHKEWDEASCPICMDHPHNAVLVVCSSHDKGCKSYICDTSYRHSNCLDRFKKLRVESKSNPSQSSSSSFESLDDGRHAGEMPLHNVDVPPRPIFETLDDYSSEENNDGISDMLVSIQEENNSQSRYSETRRVVGIGPDLHRERTDVVELSYLKCPLCRGSVRGFEIVKEARQYLDLKERSCSRESCSFTGNYKELRRHARRVHPTIRPADVDPSRQRAWHHFEHQREYGDIISAIRSAMPGAIVLGDYVIDNGDRLLDDGETRPVEGSGPWWTTFLLFHMIDEPRRLSRAWRRHRRSSGAFSGRRNLWGDNLLGLQDDDEAWNVGSDMGDDVLVPRRRRRLSRSRSDEDRL